MATASDPKTAGAKRTSRRDLPRSQRLILTSTWSHNEREFTEVTEHVRRSGVVGPLEVLMKMPHTPRRRLSVFGYLVALGLNGSTNGHKAKLADVVRLLNCFGPGALDRLGMRDWRRSAPTTSSTASTSACLRASTPPKRCSTPTRARLSPATGHGSAAACTSPPSPTWS